MGSEDAEVGLGVTFVLGLIMLPISSCVISSYIETTGFDKTMCSGLNLSRLDIDSGGICSTATVHTCVSDTDGNCTTPLKAVELYYPPTDFPLLVCKKTEDTKTWAAGLSAAKSFNCRIDDIYADGVSKGITSLLDDAVGWFILFVLSIIVWIVFIVILVVWFMSSK